MRSEGLHQSIDQREMLLLIRKNIMDHKGTVRLETERLILRRFNLGDAEDIFRNWAQSEAVTRYLTWQPYKNIDDLKGYIQYCIDEYQKPNKYNWVIEYKEIGEPIGSISVMWVREDIAACEVGYCMSERFWGMGIMPEALKEVIRFLFEEIGMNRIQATHDANNPNSGRVMEKCGMQHEGTMRQASRNTLGICDSVMRAILREDYSKG